MTCAPCSGSIIEGMGTMKPPAVIVAEALALARSETHAPHWGRNHDDLEVIRVASGMGVQEFRAALGPVRRNPSPEPLRHCPYCGADVPDVDSHVEICRYRK